MAGLSLRPLVPVVLLLVTVLAASPAQAACSNNNQGTVTIPTFTPSPPPLSDSTIETNAVYVFDIVADSNYELVALGATSTITVGGTRVVLPDFNVAWYKDNGGQGQLLANHANIGNQEGLVPSQADYGVVYMRYGPDFLSDGSIAGADFRLSTGC